MHHLLVAATENKFSRLRLRYCRLGRKPRLLPRGEAAVEHGDFLVPGPPQQPPQA
jgi:hypothetical protein